MYKNRKTGFLGNIIALIILIVLVCITNINVNTFSSTGMFFGRIAISTQNAIVHLKNKIAKNEGYFETVEQLKNELNELKDENEELKNKLQDLQIIQSENNILRKYAKLGEQYSTFEYVPSYIINKSINNIDDTFIINVGTEDGVYENMAVMSDNGLIGHTISATKKSAKVQPITDSSSNISAVTQKNRDNVIVKGMLGSKNQLIVNIIQPETELEIGDMIETSGLGGIYPKGIQLGTVSKIISTKDATEKYAIIDTSIDFEHLEYVLVLKNNGL